MSEPDPLSKKEAVALQLVKLKSASSPEEKKGLIADLALAVFDQNHDGIINFRDTNIDSWRGGLGVMPNGTDLRDEVKKELKLQDLTHKPKIKNRIIEIMTDAGRTNFDRSGLEQPNDLRKLVADFRKAEEITNPQKRDIETEKAKKAILKRFFDFNGDGTIRSDEVQISMDQIKNWQTLTQGDRNAPTIADIEIVERLAGMRDSKKSFPNITPEDILENLKKAGISVINQDGYTETENTSPSPRNVPILNPFNQSGELFMSERNDKLTEDIQAVLNARQSADPKDLEKANTQLLKDVYDKNRDGKVTRPEVKEIADDFKKFAKFDTDKSGILDPAESQAADAEQDVIKQLKTLPRALNMTKKALEKEDTDPANVNGPKEVKSILDTLKKLGVTVDASIQNGSATKSLEEPARQNVPRNKGQGKRQEGPARKGGRGRGNEE